EIGRDHIRLLAAPDKGQPAILAHLSRVQDQALHQREMLAKILMRLRLAPAIDIQSLIEQTTALGQRTINVRRWWPVLWLHLIARDLLHLSNMLINMTLCASLGIKILHPFSPEVEQKRNHPRLTIVKTVFPAQDQLQFARLAHLRNQPLPVTRANLRADSSNRRLFGLWRPTGDNLRARQLDQRPAGLFAHRFLRRKLMQSQQQISRVGIAGAHQTPEQAQLCSLARRKNIGEQSLGLSTTGTGVKILRKRLSASQELLNLSLIFLRQLGRDVFFR